jgi:glycosyltransferase involved in cell wall biosynthesis
MNLPVIAVVVPCFKRWERFDAYLEIAMERAATLATFNTYYISGPLIDPRPRTPEFFAEMAALVGGLRNKGIDAALKDGCDYIFFTDDDNLIPPDFFNIMLMYDAEPVKTCGCFNQVIDASAINYLGSYDDFGFRNVNQIGGTTRTEGLMWHKFVDHPSIFLFVKSEIFEKLEKPYFRGLQEDYGFSEQLRRAGFKSFVVPLVGVEYR